MPDLFGTPYIHELREAAEFFHEKLGHDQGFEDCQHTTCLDLRQVIREEEQDLPF